MWEKGYKFDRKSINPHIQRLSEPWAQETRRNQWNDKWKSSCYKSVIKKVAREWGTYWNRETEVRVTADLSMETRQARWECSAIIKIMRGKNCQFIIMFQVKIPFKNKEKMLVKFQAEGTQCQMKNLGLC